MYTFIYIYIQIHILEVRVKELEKKLERQSEHDKRIMSRLVGFLRKEAAEEEATSHSSN
jgi:hypothetical protein